jgi:hypothetical protein
MTSTFAADLRTGDRITVSGHVRTVERVTVGSAETRVDLAGSQYPPFAIFWNGDKAIYHRREAR